MLDLLRMVKSLLVREETQSMANQSREQTVRDRSATESEPALPDTAVPRTLDECQELASGLSIQILHARIRGTL